MKIFLTVVSIIFIAANLHGQHGVEGELIFPLQEKHVHSSSIVELPNGDLLTCWFEGSGERTANDVVINGSRLRKDETKWSDSFLMADTPGQPDCNPILFLNNNDKLFLVWIAVQANRWETSILKVRTTTDYKDEGAPKWEWQDVILLKPGVEFEKRVREQFEKYGREDLAWAEYALPYEEMLAEAAKDPKKRETGWMSRTHPTVLKSGKILLPLYSDGFNFGLIAISTDEGETWESSLPIVGRGLNQPSLVVRNDGSIDAYMRDDGDEPGRILISHSDDEGYSWSYAQKSDIPNPGASVEVIKLKSGNWLLVYNDVEDGRYSLAAAVSDDQGKSWKWKRKLENIKGGSFSYPSVIQAMDGRIHVTYSYHLPGEKKSIKHIALEEEWIISGQMIGQTTKIPVYKNPDNGIEERVEDLLAQMTLEEKVDIVGGNDFKSRSNSRLGIPEMIMTDGPLGPNAKGHSTNYSAMINLAATFNPDLMYSVAEQIGEETRIMGRNLLLGPNINIARLPHGGRTFEGFGEDPYLMSRMVRNLCL